MTVDNLLRILVLTSPIVILALVYFTGTAAAANAKKAAAAAERAEATLAASSAATAEKLEAVLALSQTIHVLCNSRLSEALDKIDRLELRLHSLTGELPTGEPPAVREAKE